MQSWIFVWTLQIRLIETSIEAQTCYWIIAAAPKNRRQKPFDGAVLITWHKYSFTETEQGKWHLILADSLFATPDNHCLISLVTIAI